MPYLVLHIGAEKTGSTAIQGSFSNCAPMLSQKVRFPRDQELPATYLGNHIGLALLSGSPEAWAWGLGRPFGLSENDQKSFSSSYIRALENLISESQDLRWDTLFLSNEHISSRVSNTAADLLTNILAPLFDQRRILLFVSRQADALFSQCGTYVRGGGTDSFSSFLSFALKRIDFDYHAQVQIWEGLGWEVDVVRYEPGQSIQLVRKYLALPPIPPEYPDKNLSPSPLAVEAIRQSNSLLMRFRASKAWQSRLQRFVSF